MKVLYRLSALLSGVLMLGCTSSYEVRDFKDPHDSLPTYRDYTIKRPFGEVKITGANLKMLEMLKRDFYSAPLAAQFSVSEIRIAHDINDPEFKNGQLGQAHFHLDSTPLMIMLEGGIPRLILPRGKICIALGSVDAQLRHEMSHAKIFFYGLSIQEIGKISEWKYNYKLWQLERREEYPKDGFLNRYSTRNAEEETADIVAGESNLFFNLPDPYTGAPSAFSGINKKDDRYLKKVEAVHKLGLTTPKEYKKVLEFFKGPR